MDFEYRERTKQLIQRFPALRRLDRAATFAFLETATAAMTSRPWLLPAFRAAARHQINKAITDPELRRRVTPTDELGCKRIMLTDDWYPTLTEPNVELVTKRIAEITPSGVRTADGEDHPADVLVLATGFKSHAFVAPMEVEGVGGRTLASEWDDVARAYLGLSVPGFPNMFVLYGPNTNGGAVSIIHQLESGIGHVIAALRELDRRQADRLEVTSETTETFNRELRDALSGTVWHAGCTNWYVDENGNDPSQWPWSWTAYRRRTATLEPGAYRFSAKELAPVAS
jgi:cation diffusion facilitator CzcD-associated flavoprotein CzcO